ncbi:MAG: sigma-70 family RNA polymerase sigma factor [Methylococcales bacterium]
MAWFDRYFTSEWEKRFKQQSYKLFFNNPTLANEAFQDAWGKLFETLQNSEIDHLPESNLDPYVFTIFKNLLHDVHRKQFGRCRPYEWVKRLGRLWEDIAILLCHENLPVAIMIEQLCNNPQYSTDGDCEEHVNIAIRQLRLKPFCKLVGVDETGLDNSNVGDETPTPHQQLEREDLVSLVETLLSLNNTATVESSMVNTIADKWQQISKQVALNDDERLILTRVYLEEDSIKQVAQELGLKYHTARRLMKGAQERLRSVFKQYDIDIETLLGASESLEH